jgi:hypothetical protein
MNKTPKQVFFNSQTTFLSEILQYHTNHFFLHKLIVVHIADLTSVLGIPDEHWRTFGWANLGHGPPSKTETLLLPISNF